MGPSHGCSPTLSLLNSSLKLESRRYMAETLPIRRKTPNNQSIKNWKVGFPFDKFRIRYCMYLSFINETHYQHVKVISSTALCCYQTAWLREQGLCLCLSLPCFWILHSAIFSPNFKGLKSFPYVFGSYVPPPPPPPNFLRQSKKDNSYPKKRMQRETTGPVHDLSPLPATSVDPARGRIEGPRSS